MIGCSCGGDRLWMNIKMEKENLIDSPLEVGIQCLLTMCLITFFNDYSLLLIQQIAKPTPLTLKIKMKTYLKFKTYLMFQ
jgi:hypothetical protein